MTSSERETLIQQSTAWWEESNQSLQSAVDQADRALADLAGDRIHGAGVLLMKDAGTQR